MKTTKSGKTSGWLVILTLAGGGEVTQVYASEAEALAARERGLGRPEYVRAAMVHYCD